MRETGTIRACPYGHTRRLPNWVVNRIDEIGPPEKEDREVSNRRQPKVAHEDLIDLLLCSDEPARRLILFTALQTGELKRSEADSVLQMVVRLERAAGPAGSPVAA